MVKIIGSDCENVPVFSLLDRMRSECALLGPRGLEARIEQREALSRFYNPQTNIALYERSLNDDFPWLPLDVIRQVVTRTRGDRLEEAYFKDSANFVHAVLDQMDAITRTSVLLECAVHANYYREVAVSKVQG